MFDVYSRPLRYERVAVYLRKSRRDIELEQAGAEDTLQRHRTVLLELAKRHGMTILQIYQEVVSGDTIEARPQMRRLLSDVEAGLYDAVLCFDIDRLGRGGMQDQGRILDTFKWSHTAIVTPDRVYNLDLDVDEEAMEYKTQGARFEYRMIKKRLARGREASVREGKFTGCVAPYGYERYKLRGQKGWSLRPVEPQAQIVRDIFRWYTASEDRLGISLIVRRLNERGIPGPTGKDWLPCTVRSILSHPVYAGMIRTKNRPEQKSMQDGVLTVSRPRTGGTTYPGLHEALVDAEVFARAAELLRTNPSRPGPKQMAMKNPLSGLVICDQCGRAMVRRPYGGDRPDGLICAYTSCPCVGSSLETVENSVLDSLRSWALSLDAASGADAAPDESEAELASLKQALACAEAELSRLAAQKARAYDLVEQGVYTIEVFSARMADIGRRETAAQAQKAALEADMAACRQRSAARRNLLPAVLHVLDAYPAAETPKEKNDLLRTVLSRITYHKTRRERWTGGSDLTLTLVPRV